VIAGRYELEREVGRGGMGAVWLARDTVLGRQVAVKRVGMVPGGSMPDLERAEREARLAARLNHPHVVAVFDLVSDDEGEWLVMEYVEGTTLAGLVSAEGALPPERATSLLRQAADALAAAHGAGIVHRDVKPSNMLVDGNDQVKLSDFGIARAEADASLTQTGLVTGSPAYLAPEVASGRTASDASDVWSIGASLYHALAGHPPYEVGDNLMGTLYKIVHEEPPRLHDAGWLAPLLERTMTRDPAERWSMSEVRDYLADGPSAARAVADPGSTQVMAPAPVAPVPAPAHPTDTPVEPMPAAAPVAAGSSGPSEGGRRRRTPWLLAVAGVVLLLVLVAIAWSLVTGGETPTAEEPSGGGGGGSSSQSEPSESEETSETPVDEPTADEMESFIDTYLTAAAADPSTSFPMLTAAFKEASGGFESYAGFWNTIDTAELVEASADPESLNVTYTWSYTRTDGTSGTDQVTLGLVYRDGTYLIDQEA
jgi:eukaryotic-like serine/threonine-protein kinase